MHVLEESQLLSTLSCESPSTDLIGSHLPGTPSTNLTPGLLLVRALEQP